MIEGNSFVEVRRFDVRGFDGEVERGGVVVCVCEAKRDRQFGTRLEGPPNLGTDEPSVFLAAIGGSQARMKGESRQGETISKQK